MVQFQKLKKLLAQNKHIIIYEVESGGKLEQWFSDGIGYYRISGFPIITKESQLLSLMDVKEQEKDKYHVEFDAMPGNLLDAARLSWDAAMMEANVRDELTIGDLTPVYYKNLLGVDKTMLIHAPHLAPIREEPYTQYVVRPIEIGRTKTNVLCVREDMFGQLAIIPPVDLVRLRQPGGLLDDLARIIDAIRLEPIGAAVTMETEEKE